MNKALIFCLIVVFASAFNFIQKQELTISPELQECAKGQCPTQYKKCQDTTGCPQKMNKAADKCGEKVNQLCWASVVGITGPAVDLATCAVNQGCIKKSLQISNCYQDKCLLEFNNCVVDRECREQLVSCKAQKNSWNFNSQCIEQKSSKHAALYQFYTCAGQNKCL